MEIAMPMEIERKFLVSGTGWRRDRGTLCRQGYLNHDKERTVRIRIADQQAFLTIKGISRGASRIEFEYEIPREDAEQLLKFCAGCVIQKIRHTVMHKGSLWEVDEFLGDNQGLIMAEIELDSEDQPFEKPSWLGQEVTTDPRYANSNLSLNPFQQWSDTSPGSG
jgi:CYTH domain-containing protein